MANSISQHVVSLHLCLIISIRCVTSVSTHPFSYSSPLGSLLEKVQCLPKGLLSYARICNCACMYGKGPIFHIPDILLSLSLSGRVSMSASCSFSYASAIQVDYTSIGAIATAVFLFGFLKRYYGISIYFCACIYTAWNYTYTRDVTGN